MELRISTLLICCLLPLLWPFSEAQSDDDFLCTSLSRDNYTCASCLQYDKSCAWCSDPAFDDDKYDSRCDKKEKLVEYNCPENHIQNPASTTNIELNKELASAESGEPIQLKPQIINIKLRPNDTREFKLYFRQARDYPVDLYYLMDLSNSMADDKDKIVTLGGELARRMKQITSDFKLGFGSFVDKKAVPFVDPRPEKMKVPCKNCVEPYAYKHQMSLASDAQEFQKRVNMSRISGNLDSPEGGFDALMQALVCDQIGWRQKSRKMLVFSTDAGFHFAGDGRLAGIVVPNDETCHLDGQNMYTKGEELDYPSIAQIHKIVRQKQANLIFAVTEKQLPLYESLQRALPDVSAAVGKLQNDSSNIVELIVNEYSKISQKIIMVDDAEKTDGGIKISYQANCTKNDAPNICDKVSLNETVAFTVTAKALKCKKNPNENKYQIKIGPSGLEETLQLNIEVLCDCDCAEDVISRSPVCSNVGDQVCGVCSCPIIGGIQYSGDLCQCSEGSSQSTMMEKCKKTLTSEICEGRGECVCGKCECNNLAITGKFCDCDHANCPRYRRKTCAGHGRCNCGKCICDEGWTNRDCSCEISKDKCMKDGIECSGNGVCECGVCRCKDERYSGALCNVCHTCPTKCDEYKQCVMCQRWGTGTLTEDQCKNCTFTITDKNLIVVEELPKDDEEHANDTIRCQAVDQADDCTFYYSYVDHKDDADAQPIVYSKKDQDCPPPVPVLAIVLGVIAGIVLIGLILLLVWKLLTVLHDRREFAAFEKDRLNAKWDTGENPMFNPATTTFKNPVYGGR